MCIVNLPFMSGSNDETDRVYDPAKPNSALVPHLLYPEVMSLPSTVVRFKCARPKEYAPESAITVSSPKLLLCQQSSMVDAETDSLEDLGAVTP
jgi:hypothetical protein